MADKALYLIQRFFDEYLGYKLKGKKADFEKVFYDTLTNKVVVHSQYSMAFANWTRIRPSYGGNGYAFFNVTTLLK